MKRIFLISTFILSTFVSGVLSRPLLAELKPSIERTVSPRIVELEGLNDRPADLVLLGDSLTERGRWNERLTVNVANRGIGRDTVVMVANRADMVPSGPIYLMIGVNDLIEGFPLEEIVADYRLLLSKLEGREVVVQSVLGPSSLPVTELNARLRELTDETGAEFLDLTPAFGHPIKSRYTTDGVHLTSEGYDRWAQAIMAHYER